MADGPRESWWKSLPGLLTAATGFVAALSGLVAGLNQLGVFRRDQPAPQVVSTAPGPRDTSPEETATVPRASSSSTAPAAEPGRDVPEPVSAPSRLPAATPARPRMPSGSPAGDPDSTHRAAPADTSAAQPTAPSASIRLPKGTALELEVPTRTCAPSDGARRFTARLASPVRTGGSSVLPEGTIAVLHLRGAADTPLQVRLDSLVPKSGESIAPSTQVRLRRDALNGSCLRAHARLTAALISALEVRRP